MIRRATHSGIARGAIAALALLALIMAALVPQGFMPGTGSGAPLVICTGHGPVALTGAADQTPAKSERAQKGQTVCAFAGHGVVSPPTPGPSVVMTVIRRAPAVAVVRSDLAPGLGLAAPPPPSQGPPQLL